MTLKFMICEILRKSEQKIELKELRLVGTKQHARTCLKDYYATRDGSRRFTIMEHYD